MQDFSSTPIEMFASLWRNRSLILASAKRDVLGRYRGSAVGLLWSFFNPVLMLAVYTFVFGEIFKTRWSSGSESKIEFALVLFVGLIVFNLFSECINRAPVLVVSKENYVKKVVFPLEILPFVELLSALFHGAISLCVWLLAYSILIGMPPVTVLYLPVIVIPFLLFILGLSWGLASLGVFVRDVGQFIGIATTFLLFLSPVFYPVTAWPQSYRYLIYINPITPAVEAARAVLYFGETPSFMLLGFYWAIAFMIAWFGFAWFQKTRKGFADVM